MHSNTNKPPHNRHSIRLKGYDYTQPSAYFVTLVMQGRQMICGEVKNGEMHLNAIGKIIQREWLALPQRFPSIRLDAFIIMPNHLHAIIQIIDPVGATHPNLPNFQSAPSYPPTQTLSGNDGLPLPHPIGAPSGSLGAVIGQFKSRVTKQIWRSSTWKGVPIWQRNYFEHIIRTESEYHNIALYIAGNPAKWATDNENPAIA